MVAEHVAAGLGLEGYILGHLHTPAELTEVRTAPRRLTEHTCWAESLAFPLPGGYKTEGEVALSLRSLDCFSQDVDLGDMRFKLADVAMMSDADCWVELQPPKQVPLLLNTYEGPCQLKSALRIRCDNK